MPLAPLLRDANGAPITTAEGWAARRKQIESFWLEFLGPPPAERAKAPPFQVLEEDTDAGVVRQRIRYYVEPEIGTEAYLLRPRLRSGASCSWQTRGWRQRPRQNRAHS